MLIDAELAAVATAFRTLGDLILAAGGSLHPGLCLHQQGSALWASVDTQALAENPDTPLIFVPESLLIPVAGLNWDLQDRLEPSSGLDTLSPLQRQALEQMLALYALTEKLANIQPLIPALALPRDSALATLLQSGHPRWAPKGRSHVMATFLFSRLFVYNSSAGAVTEDSPLQERDVLMPLTDVLNHHPAGAGYKIRQGGLWVKAKPCGNGNECFARYGYKDAMHLLIHYGYVAREPRFVQSISCDVRAEGFGRLRIRYQDHRPPMDLPGVEIQPDGLTISHLNLDADQPDRALKILRVVAGGLRIADLDRSARSALDAIRTANWEYYRKLQVLAQAAANVEDTVPITTMLAEVAQHQTALLEEI